MQCVPRHRIITAGMKRMTLDEPRQTEPASLPYAVRPNSLNKIFGTGGMKPALAAQERRKQQLVYFNQQNHCSFHDT